MEKSTYTAGARKALLIKKKSAVYEDMKICTYREGEVFGKIMLDSECPDRDPSGMIYTYEPLGIVIDTRENDCWIKEMNRSCEPNMQIQHVFGRHQVVSLFACATEKIKQGVQLTLPFNHDWKLSDSPLICGIHREELCPMEGKRQKLADLRKTFREMGREKLEGLADAVAEMMSDMVVTGSRTGKITVSSDEITFKTGKTKTRKLIPSTSAAVTDETLSAIPEESETFIKAGKTKSREFGPTTSKSVTDETLSVIPEESETDEKENEPSTSGYTKTN